MRISWERIGQSWREKRDEWTLVTIVKGLSPLFFIGGAILTFMEFTQQKLALTLIFLALFAVAYEVDNFRKKLRKELALIEPFFSVVHDRSHRYLTTLCSDLIKNSGSLVTGVRKGKIHIDGSTACPIDQEVLFYSVVAEILNRFLRDQGKDIEFVKMMHDLPPTGVYPSLISKLQLHTAGLPDQARRKIYKLYVFQGRTQYNSDDFKLEAPKLGNEAWRWAPQLPFGNLLFEENMPEENIRLLYRTSGVNFGKDGNFEVYNDLKEEKLSMELAWDGSSTVEFAIIKASHRRWPLLSRKMEETVKVAVRRDKRSLSFLSGDIFLDREVGKVWDESYFEKLFRHGEAKQWSPANAEVALNSAYNILLNGTGGNKIQTVDYNRSFSGMSDWLAEGSPKWIVWRASAFAAKNGTVERIFLVSNAQLGAEAQSGPSSGKWLNYELLLLVLGFQAMAGIQAKVLTIEEYHAGNFAMPVPEPDFALILTPQKDLLRGITWSPHAIAGSERYAVIHGKDDGASWKDLFEKIDFDSHPVTWLLEKIKLEYGENDLNNLLAKVTTELNSRAQDQDSSFRDRIVEWEKAAREVLGE